jgi:hypothetical protein
MQNYNSKKMPQKGKKIFGKPLKGPDIYNKGKDKIIFTPENWRTVKQFELSTSESESSTESENDTEKQFDELKTVLETEKRLREEAEKKLAETLKQLEDSKKSEPTMEQIQRVETPTQITTKAIVEHTPPSDKSVHLNFTRSFFSNPPNNTMATKSHSITIADQLEQDLKNMDKTVVTLTTPVYIKETESQLPLSNAAAQLMAEHKKQLEQDKKELKSIIRDIKIMETCTDSHKFEHEIKEAQETYQEKRQKYIDKKKEMIRAEEIAERYEPRLEYPEFPTRPRDYVRPYTALSMKNILTNVPKFNPDQPDKGTLEETWNAALQFGTLEYFDEQDFHRVLVTVLQGQAHRTYKEMVKQNKPLREILNTLQDLYGTQNTIEEDQAAVDSFKRQPKETIKRAMKRLSVLIDRLRCLYDPLAWKEMSYHMQKTSLMQIITDKTRKYIEHEINKTKKYGVQIPLKDLIDQVHEYETSHNQVPKNEVAIVYSVGPTNIPNWVNQLGDRQKAIKSQKHEAADIQRIANMIGQATTQVASAVVKDKTPPKGKHSQKLEKMLHSVMKPQRSSSNSSQRERNTDVDTDTEMVDLDTSSHSNKSNDNRSNKNYRADKRERGRSEKKENGYKSNQHRSYSGKSNRDRSSSQKSDYSKKDYQNKDKKDYKNKSTPHHSSERKKSYSDKGSNKHNEKVELVKSYQKRDDGKIVIDNKVYYTCACASMHQMGQDCPIPTIQSKN